MEIGFIQEKKKKWKIRTVVLKFSTKFKKFLVELRSVSSHVPKKRRKNMIDVILNFYFAEVLKSIRMGKKGTCY